jgi:hypothetical protein
MKKAIAALIAFAAIVLPQSAIAQTVFFRGLDKVLIFEGAANSPFEAFIWTGKTKIFTANPCGLIIVPTREHSFQRVFAGTNIGYSTLPVQTLVTCSTGVLSEPRPTNFKTPDGRTVLVGRSGSVEVQYIARSRRSGTFNACGFKTATIKNADAVGADSIPIDFGGQTKSLGDIPQVSSLPLCRKVGNEFVKYIKLN